MTRVTGEGCFVIFFPAMGAAGTGGRIKNE